MLAALAVAVALVALVASAAPLRREGWAFTGKVDQISDQKVKNSNFTHREFIRKHCSAGREVQWFTQNDKWKWMARYSEGAVRKLCDESRGEATNVTTRQNANADACRYKCTDDYLKFYRPCANKAGTRCCKKGEGTKVTDCVDSAPRAAYSDLWGAVSNQKPTGGGGGKKPDAGYPPVPAGSSLDARHVWGPGPYPIRAPSKGGVTVDAPVSRGSCTCPSGWYPDDKGKKEQWCCIRPSNPEYDAVGPTDKCQKCADVQNRR